MTADHRNVIALASALALSGGCAVLDWTTQSRTRTLARQDIHASDVTLGPDRVHYWRGGREGDDVDTVVMLHGFGGNALFQWYPQMRALAQHYRLLVPDLLWFGDSSSDDRNFSVRHQAAVVGQLLDYEGVSRAHIVGLSYGGIVTHEVISADPERFERVVLVASPARAFLADDKQEVLAEFGVSTAEDLLLPRDYLGLRRLMSLAYYDPPWVPRFVAEQIVARFYAPRRTEHVAMLSEVQAHTQEHRQRYGPPRHDTLILWGEADRVFPERAAWRLRRELGPKAEICVLDKAAHAPHLERDKDATRLILAFLRAEGVECVGRSIEIGSEQVDGPT